MKKILALAFLTAMSVLAATGCAKDSGTSPTSAAPTATPVTLTAGTIIGSFESANLNVTISGVNGSWTTGTDSADGGTSPSPVLTVTNSTASEGTYSCKLNATINSVISFPGSALYTSLSMPPTPVPDKIGYVTQTLTFDTPVELVSTAQLSHDLMFNSYAGVNYRIFIYNSSGQYASSVLLWPAGSGSWGAYSPTLSGFTPGGAYTLSDVLKTVTKITFLFTFKSQGNSSASLVIGLDNLRLQ